MGCQSGTSKWKSCDSVATIIEKGGCFDGKKHSEKEKTSLDSPSPKLNKDFANMSRKRRKPYSYDSRLSA